MTFKEVIKRTHSLMDAPLPPVEEVHDYIRSTFGIDDATVILLSQDHVRMLVDGAVWCLMHPWGRAKFNELCRVGP